MEFSGSWGNRWWQKLDPQEWNDCLPWPRLRQLQSPFQNAGKRPHLCMMLWVKIRNGRGMILATEIGGKFYEPLCEKCCLCYNFIYPEPWLFPFYSSLRPNRSWLISYDILTALSVSLTAEFPLTDYFSHDYSSWLITYDTLSQIDLVCAPDPLVYKPSVQTVFL